MTEKQTYYISLDKHTIDKVSVPDTTEYEVRVTPEELETFIVLLEENDKRDFLFATKNIHLIPFNEKKVDEMREKDNDNLMKMYQLLYEFGTQETKEKLAEIGFDRE